MTSELLPRAVTLFGMLCKLPVLLICSQAVQRKTLSPWGDQHEAVPSDRPVLESPALYFASTCWLAYDSTITFDQEHRFIWCSSWSLPKALYLSCRYGGLGLSLIYTCLSIGQVSPDGCLSLPVLALAVGVQIITIPADGLLLMRVWSLYQDRRLLCRCLVGYFVLEKLAEVGVVAGSVVLGANLLSSQSSCYASSTNKTVYTAAGTVAPLVFNCILFGLTVAKVAPYWRIHGYGLSPFLHAFVRDGTIYFLLICCSLALLIIITLSVDSPLELMMFFLPWHIAVYPVAACRLLLQLRCSVNRPTLETTVQAEDPGIPTFRVPSEASSIELSSLEGRDTILSR